MGNMCATFNNRALDVIKNLKMVLWTAVIADIRASNEEVSTTAVKHLLPVRVAAMLHTGCLNDITVDTLLTILITNGHTLMADAASDLVAIAIKPENKETT